MADVSDRIIATEWMFFDKVNNIGGRASCQDDLRTFAIMRKSQLYAWDEVTRESWLCDLRKYEIQARNPISEKYGYMMEYSSPAEFKRIEMVLPGVSMGKRMTVTYILKVLLRWEEEVICKYPSIRGRGRPLYTKDDKPWNVSFETYARGELYTYSERTLQLYKAHIDRTLAAGGNLAEDILRAMARLSG